MSTIQSAPSSDNHIPQLLRGKNRWCRWSLQRNANGKLTKRPDCSTWNPAAWRSYDGTKGPSNGIEGRGFILTNGVEVNPGERLYALDLDSCVFPDGRIAPWATQLIADLGNTYTELSPSRKGLRALVIVTEDWPDVVRSRVKCEVEGSDPAKPPELQLFGTGAACYVTLTGERLNGVNTEPTRLRSIDHVLRQFGMQHAGPAPSERYVEPPGDAPSQAEIGAAMKQIANCDALLEAHWQEIAPEASASEVWAVLVQHVLRAARGHVEATVRFLLDCTAWGRGEVDESADPERYSKERWVRRDVTRLAAKTPPPTAEVFEAIPDEAPVDAPTKLFYRLPTLLSEVSAVDFLVYKVIPRRGSIQFFGDPGCGKTPFALSLAIHVACPKFTHWFGHEIDHHGDVVYIAGEDLAGVRSRLQAELLRLQLSPEEVPIHVSKRPARLTQASDVKAWVAGIRSEVGQAALLVIDTQAANFGPGDENSNTDMMAFWTNVSILSSSLGCCSASVHHVGHGDKSRARGGFSQTGIVDGDFLVTRDGMVVTLTPGKCKNWEQQPPIRGLLKVVTLGDDPKHRPITAITLADEAPPEDPFGDLEPEDGRPQDLSHDEWTLVRILFNLQGRPITDQRLADQCALSRRALSRRIDTLLERGLIERAAGGTGRGAEGSRYRVCDPLRRACEIAEITG